MTAPNLSITVKDGGLGTAPETADGVHVKIGVASGLTALSLYTFTSLAALQASGAIGPAVDAAAVALNTVVNGKAPPAVLIFPVTPSTAATSGSITETRVSTSVGTVASTGSSPKDQYNVIVLITTSGTLGAGVFQYSLDGGDTYSAPITIPSGGTYTVPNSGVVVVFDASPSGSLKFEAGDKFTWSTTAPAMTTSDIASAVTALLALTTAWEGIHIVGAPADETATATLFAALATHADTIEASKRYRWVFMEAADVSNSLLKTAMASSSHIRMFVGGGWEELYIPTTKMVLKRPSAWPILGRAMAIPVHEDPARVASGPLSGIVSLYHNEDTATVPLDSDRFSTLRQFVNNDPAGFYVTNVRVFGGALSDFKYMQHRRVMDKACTLSRSFLLQLLSDSTFLDPKTGLILEESAVMIEEMINAKLRAAMGNSVSDISFKVSRTDNLLTTSTLTEDERIIPLGYFKNLAATIGYFNPALAPA